MAVVPVTGVHHPGLVVSDLARSLTFYRAMFGVEPDLMLERIGGPELAALHDLPVAEISLAMLAFGNAHVELIEYHAPVDGARSQARACDLGAGHVALEVEDVEQACLRLAAAGMRFLGKPLHVEDGPAAGWVVAYGLDPDGNRIELLQTR